MKKNTHGVDPAAQSLLQSRTEIQSKIKLLSDQLPELAAQLTRIDAAYTALTGEAPADTKPTERRGTIDKREYKYNADPRIVEVLPTVIQFVRTNGKKSAKEIYELLLRAQSIQPYPGKAPAMSFAMRLSSTLRAVDTDLFYDRNTKTVRLK